MLWGLWRERKNPNVAKQCQQYFHLVLFVHHSDWNKLLRLGSKCQNSICSYSPDKMTLAHRGDTKNKRCAIITEKANEARLVLSVCFSKSFSISTADSPSAIKRRWSRTRWTRLGNPSPSPFELSATATMIGQKTVATIIHKCMHTQKKIAK